MAAAAAAAEHLADGREAVGAPVGEGGGPLDHTPRLFNFFL